MGQQAKNSKNQRTHAVALQAAIANLEQFAKKNESSPIVHVADLSVNEGKLVAADQTSLQKTMALARCFVSALFSTKSRQLFHEKKIQVQDVVLRAIDVIKRNHLLIEQMKQGTPEEQKLAATTLAAIKRYNAVFEQTGKSTLALRQSIARFFYRFSGLSVEEALKDNRIDLPRGHMIQCKLSAQAPDLKISHAFQSLIAPAATFDRMHGFSAVMLTKMMADPLSKQETDLLRMKANTLLRQNGIRFKSMSEALQAIKESPIQTTFNEQTSIAVLRLVLTLIPGITIEIQGAFQRDKQTPVHSVPIPEQFRLAITALHNGFPHPLQHSGWALGNALIPPYPHRLDQMPLFKPLYMRKQEVMKALLPEGALFENARELWKKKAQAFSEGTQELLKLHRELSLAIMRAAPSNQVQPETEQCIEEYFDRVAVHPSPMDYIARTYQAINEHFIERPHAKLQEVWLTRTDNDGAKLLTKARTILGEDNVLLQEILSEQCSGAVDEFEKQALSYVACIGNFLQPSFQSILLQHFSETFGCAPRMLNDFEQKLQVAAYKQLMSFLDALDNPFSSVEKLRECLQSDIAIFQVDNCDSLDIPPVHISHELEVYFNSRYYSAL